eukprot:409138_1
MATQHLVSIVIHYNNRTMSYYLPKDIGKWNDDTFTALHTIYIPTQFNIHKEFIICNANNSVQIHAIQDLIHEYKSHVHDPDFKSLNLNIITEQPVKSQRVQSITDSQPSTPDSIRALEEAQGFFDHMQVEDTMGHDSLDIEGSAEPPIIPNEKQKQRAHAGHPVSNNQNNRAQRGKTVSYSNRDIHNAHTGHNGAPLRSRYNSYHNGHSSQVIKEGYIWKKGAATYAGWKKRYFKLVPNKQLRYYANKSTRKPKGIIDIDGLETHYIKTTAKAYDSKQFGFCIVTADRTYRLSVTTSRDRTEWIEKLRQYIDPNYHGFKPRTQSATFAEPPANRLNSVPNSRRKHKKNKKASSDLSSMHRHHNMMNEEKHDMVDIVEEEPVVQEVTPAHRIYLLSPYKSNQTFVSIDGVSDEYVEMKAVSLKSPYLWFLDIVIPIDFEQTSIKFNCFTDEGVKQIQPKNAFQKSLRGYYHIERDNVDASKGRGWFNGFDIRNEVNKASSLILQQLVNEINDWKAYNHSVAILQALQYVWTTENLWNSTTQTMLNHYEMKHIFELQLLDQAIREDDDFSVNIPQMYHIVETVNSCLGFHVESIQNEIGIALYDSFIERVQHFCRLQSKYMSPKNYLLLYSIVNVMRYFEKMKHRHKSMRCLQWINYKQSDEYFNKDSWTQLDLMKMLRIDLDIGSLDHRMYPLEIMLLRLCSIKHNQGRNAVDLFRNSLEIISTRSKQQTETVITDIFKYDDVIRYIFNILGNSFDTLWRELILTLQPQRIATNKKILNAFHEHLKWQIAAMDRDNVKLQELDALIMAFESKNSSAQPLPKSQLTKISKHESCKLCNKTIKDGSFAAKFVHVHHCKYCGFVVCENCSGNRRLGHRICDYCYKDRMAQDIVDTINIRLALLQNTNLIEYVDDHQIKRNLKYILKIVLRGDAIDEHIAGELIVFMTRLFITEQCTNIALIAFTSLIAHNITFSECFREALKRSLAQKVSLPVKIAMFLRCPQFYELVNAHHYFIDLFVIRNKNEIQSWNARQVHTIQMLAQKYTQKGDKTGIKLWSNVFDKLICIPQAESSQSSRRLSYLFSKKANKQTRIKVMKPQQEQKYMEGDSDSEGFMTEAPPPLHDHEIAPPVTYAEENASFITQLEFCLSMTAWIKFAMKMKQIPALKSLIQYIQNRLGTLNGYISAERHVNIKSLGLFKAKQTAIIQLAMECDYFKRFDDRKLNAMIQELDRLSNFKLYLIRFLGRFTVPNEDPIRDETHEFVDYIKHWDLKQYSEVKARPEWNRWMHPNAAKFMFLFEMQSSDVFYNLWCAQRRKTRHTVWDFQNYLNVLYPKVRHQWDDLVDRAMKSRLTFNDISWFKDLNSSKELKMMQLPHNKIRDTRRDIAHSLKIDSYVAFVDTLTKMVNIFIQNGNTRIRHHEDRKWSKLKENLIISKQKKNDKTQSIAEVARLYRDIKSLVSAQYSNLHVQWIRAVVMCQENEQTVHKMANDAHFQRESLQETLELLDDSNDGEMTQLSGSLRSVHSLFLSIWQNEHKTKTDLMQFIADMELKPNDANNLRQVADALSRIDHIMAELIVNPEVRDMEKLDDAISNGYFRFDTQNIITREIKQSNHVETKQIGNKCMYLDGYNVTQIQRMIDIILLCRDRSSWGDPDDDEKNIYANDQMKGDVHQYIAKINICKEISELRVQFILIGGRMERDAFEKIRASSPLNAFNRKQNEWKTRVQNWKDHVLALRNESHLFNYYTINNIRLIIHQLNQCKRSGDSVNGLRFQELLAQLRFARPELTASQLRKMVKSWKVMNANSDESLQAFKECFNNKIIMNVYERESNKKNYDLTNARPNLLIVKQRSEAIFATLNLYFTSSVLSKSFTDLLSPHQVLLCTKHTTSEDIFIFIFRCLQNEKRFKYNGISAAPLYCLLFPEDLNHHILDDTVRLFNYYLLSKNQAVIHYSLLVISCDESNTLCHILSAYRTNTVSCTVSSNICSTLFNGTNDNEMMKNDKPFIQLYQSLAVGLGKSFVIKEKATQWQGNKEDLIRIPFNSPKIDLDFVVERLYKAYDGRKRRKQIYHLDISPSATNTVNDVLFSLFFLKFIKTAKDRCFCVTTDMAFLIEEPTDLASLKTKQKYKKTPVKDEFYILHSPMVFTKHKISIQSNVFQLNDNCHYAARFLSHFYDGDLQTQDPNPMNERTHKVNRLSKQDHDAMMRRRFPSVPRASPIRRKAFWEYLYTQFVQVVHSVLLNNEWHRDDHQHFNKWK